LTSRFARAASTGFDPVRDLARIGLANQTTMLSTESLAIGEMFRAAMRDRYGDTDLPNRYRAFDTICSATQDRQDAVAALLQEDIDVMVVVGGYNSSNTISLAALCAERVPTYHIEDAEGIDPDTGMIRHLPIGGREEVSARDWLPRTAELRVGLTAGASTPNNKIGETVARIFAARGIDPASIG
jgi:4-hydroxy-3-methylbut-2-enyl diphosphate reductase